MCSSDLSQTVIVSAISSSQEGSDIEQIDSIKYFAGHSVGEITAAALAQVIDGATAMKLVRARGLEMAKAATGTDTGMSAVLGGERDVVIAALSELGLTAANENGGGQIVAAGSLNALAKLAENPPAGSRVRPRPIPT